jgi:tRNA(Ile)-lysidine synthase
VGEGDAAGGGLARRVARHLERSGLITSDDVVCVALSGGLDSVVLLHLLRFPLRRQVGPLSAAHLDHAMRPDSDADARWVAGLCRAWEVPLTSHRAAVPPRSEADARRIRYAFLEGAAPTGALILTGHHADDQAETVLFRLSRGSGLGGLRGIAPRRGRVVRPLLPFGRHELAGYAADVGLAFRTDPTNLELDYARNRIRHRVLPELERARPGAARELATLAAHARREEQAWDQVLERLAGEVVIEEDSTSFTLARAGLRSYHPQLRARLLRHLLRRYGPAPGRAGTQAALEFITSGSSGGSVDLPGGVRLERDFNRIRVVLGGPETSGLAAAETGEAEEVAVIPAVGTGRARLVMGGGVVEVEWGAGLTGPAAERVIVASPRFPLRVRGWRPGDRIRLSYGTKKLKKLFSERRLDRRARARIPVLVDGRGEVLWVVGLARAEGVGEGGEGLEIAVRDVRQL